MTSALARQSFDQGFELHRRGDVGGAISFYQHALDQDPGQIDARHMLGVAFLQTGKTDEGIALIEDVVRRDQANIGARLNLANAHSELGRHQAALDAYGLLMALAPDHAEAMLGRAHTLRRLGRAEEALEDYNRALIVTPRYAEALAHRADTLHELDRLEECLATYDRLIAIQPGDARAHSNRGNVLRGLGRTALALADYDKAIALDPGFADAHFNRGLGLLSLGDYPQGWQDYEWRKGLPEPIAARAFDRPVWTGAEDVSGKTLFIYGEQGLGDTMHFCRYALKVIERGARVIMAAHDGLRHLLQTLSPVIEIIGEEETPPVFDYHCAMMSLPLAFGTTVETVPAPVPYLRADPARVEAWRQKLGAAGNKKEFKIGICWLAKPVRALAGRSFPLQSLAKIAALPGVRLISLQKAQSREVIALPPGMAVEDTGPDFDSGGHAFADTAAAMENLDLVITADTSIAHLAGALGRKVWVALRHSPDWRWMTIGHCTPWYPGMRLFRQNTRGDWAPVFAAMRTELEKDLRS
jgi:tetratricopeptide (TPR) repeat protein